jgi:hypothetical protein
MPIIDFLSERIINSITENLDIQDYTRAELRNFLNGRITTVTDETEFGNSLKSLTQDIEAGGGLAEGEATGSIIGAIEGGALITLEGGIIGAKGAEIVSSLLDIYNATSEGEESRKILRDQLEQANNRGVYHGAEGTPSRNAQGLIEQAARQEERARQKGNIFDESERKFSNDDPPLRQRQPIEDDFKDVPLTATEAVSTADPVLPNPQRGRPPRGRPARPPILPILPLLPFTLIPTVGGRRPDLKVPNLKVPDTDTGTPRTPPETTPPDTGTPRTPPERTNPGNNMGDRGVAGGGKLRADFLMLGTSYFNEMYNTPLSLENSEWAEYDYVDIDRQNKIEMDNFLGDAIRFKSPMFLPKFQPKLAPPSKLAVELKYVPMRPEIQLYQPFMDKFDGADMGRNMNFTDPFNRSVFDSNFKNLELYNPI